MKPGIYPGLPMADYLAIDALSTTPLRTAIEECPRAGWWRSRLNPNRPREQSSEMDIGSIAHSVLLEDSWECVAIIRPEDYPSKVGTVPKGWTNDAIRAARDDARAAGRYPILPDDVVDVRAMVDVAKSYIESLRTTEPAIWRAFQPDGGASEVTMVWQDGDLLCKLRTDRISADHGVICDYKTSGMSVEPNRWGRTQMQNLGHDFGAAWYRRGVETLTGVRPDYVYLCQETTAPFLCSLIGVDPERVALGNAKVEKALRLWRQCLATGQWDGYPNRCVYPELPPWEMARWMEQDESTDEHGIPYDVAKLFRKSEAK